MHDPTVDAQVLKMEKPVLAVGELDPTALVRAVDVGRPLLEHEFGFVGAKRLFRAKRQLPSGFDATGRSEDVIPAVATIPLGAFKRGVDVVSAVDQQVLLADHLAAVARHLVGHQDRVFAGPAFGESVYEIRLIAVPERTGINQTGPFLYHV